MKDKEKETLPEGIQPPEKKKQEPAPPALVQQGHQLMSLEDAKEWYRKFVEISKDILKEDVDYGKFPGVPKKVLWKAGAEKLKFFYKMGVRQDLVDKEERWDDGYFSYVYKCTVVSAGGIDVGEAEGECNTFEDQFRYRWNPTDKTPKDKEAQLLKVQKKGKWLNLARYGEKKNWIWHEKISNPNPAAQKNTIRKMAQKRAFVSAILMSTGASEFFTQDLEDIVEDVPYNEEKAAPTAKDQDDSMKAFDAVKSAKTIEELTKVWNSHKDLQGDTKFSNAVKARKENLTKSKKS